MFLKVEKCSFRSFFFFHFNCLLSKWIEVEVQLKLLAKDLSGQEKGNKGVEVSRRGSFYTLFRVSFALTFGLVTFLGPLIHESFFRLIHPKANFLLTSLVYNSTIFNFRDS